MIQPPALVEERRISFFKIALGEWVTRCLMYYTKSLQIWELALVAKNQSSANL